MCAICTAADTALAAAMATISDDALLAVMRAVLREKGAGEDLVAGPVPVHERRVVLFSFMLSRLIMGLPKDTNLGNDYQFLLAHLNQAVAIKCQEEGRSLKVIMLAPSPDLGDLDCGSTKH